MALTDREVLEAILYGEAWGSCEELAYPAAMDAIQGYLDGDPDAERYIRIRSESKKDKSEEQKREEYTFVREYEGRYDAKWELEQL